MTSQSAMDAHMNMLNAAWQTIRIFLENRKRQIYEEIRDYPTPIAACDQQFNYLLDERARLAQELQRLYAARADEQQHDPLEALDAFVQSSGYKDDLSVIVGQSGQTNNTKIMATR